MSILQSHHTFGSSLLASIPIFDSDSMSIWHDKRSFVYVQWKGYISPSKMKDDSIFLLDSMQERNCKMIIIDSRLVRGTWLQAVPWFGKYFFPMVARKGVTKAAFIYAPNTFGQRAMERTLEVNKHFEAQAFQEYQPAENWLLNHHNKAANFLNRKMVVKEKDCYRVLPHKDILYLFSNNKGTGIQTMEETCLTNKSLKECFGGLPNNFIQIHRSYVVNTQHIIAMKHHNSGSYHVFLKDLPRIKIPVGKKYISALKELLIL